MTGYELARLSMEPFLPCLEGIVRKEARKLLKEFPHNNISILDIGGRKSPYTIGLSASVTIIDLPRNSRRQEELFLGISSDIVSKIQKQRSNISEIILQDMTECTLTAESYDGVICVEVIEHIVKDQKFVQQVQRVLKPGGWLVLTTPNGDYIKNTPPSHNPDHVRHYTKSELMNLLFPYFENVEIHYAVKTSRNYLHGLRKFNYKHPLSLINTMASNLVNTIQSAKQNSQAIGTAKLLAVARKRNG